MAGKLTDQQVNEAIFNITGDDFPKVYPSEWQKGCLYTNTKGHVYWFLGPKDRRLSDDRLSEILQYRNVKEVN